MPKKILLLTLSMLAIWTNTWGMNEGSRQYEKEIRQKEIGRLVRDRKETKQFVQNIISSIPTETITINTDELDNGFNKLKLVTRQQNLQDTLEQLTEIAPKDSPCHNTLKDLLDTTRVIGTFDIKNKKEIKDITTILDTLVNKTLEEIPTLSKHCQQQIPPALLSVMKQWNESDRRYQQLKNPNFMQRVIGTCKSNLTSSQIIEGTKEIAITSFKSFAVHELATSLSTIWHGELPYVPFLSAWIKNITGANTSEKLKTAAELTMCIENATDKEEGYALCDRFGETFSSINKLPSTDIKVCQSITGMLQQCSYSNPITTEYATTKYNALVSGKTCPSYKNYKKQAEKDIKAFQQEETKRLQEKLAAQKTQAQEPVPQPDNLKDASTNQDKQGNK